MSRTPHASLYELIAAQLVQASQVFANTLTFDCLYARYVDHSPTAKSDRSDFSKAIESFTELRSQVAELLQDSRALLDRAGSMDLIRFAQERTQLKFKFDSLINRAGVLHDYVLSTASMAPPDMSWSWRRLEVTDQHARNTVTKVAQDVIEILTKLIDPDREPPSVIIDYRHFHQNRNITRDDKSIYLTAPFWAVYLPRVGAGIVAHECAHSAAKEILADEVKNGESTFATSLRDIHTLIAASVGKKDLNEHEQLRAKLSVEVILGELLADVLAAEVLGPWYIINLAEILIGNRRVRTGDQYSVHYVPPNLRINLLLGLYDTQRLAPSDPEPAFLLEQVRASVREYERVNEEIIADSNDASAAKRRKDWVKFQEDLLYLTEPGIEDFIDRRLRDDTSMGISSIIRSARERDAVQAYSDVWQKADDIARRSADAQQGHARELLAGLESLTEVRSFILAGGRTPPTLETGESWSLDWWAIRARSPDDRTGRQEPPKFDELTAWMKAFAEPSAQPYPPKQKQGICGVYGLVLGAVDGFILRPFLRVRQEAKLDPDVHRRGLAAYVERRALVEIVELKSSRSTLWSAGDWSESCFISEVLLHDQDPESFLCDIVTSAGETGLQLKRAFIGTGWMSVVLFLQPVKSDWRSRLRYMGKPANAPARSVTSIICSLAITHEREEDDRLVYPWDHCADEHAMRVQSSLRVREAAGIFDLAQDRSSDAPTIEPGLRGPDEIHPTFGPFDGVATFNLENPKELPRVARWLYQEIARGRLIRSVTSIPAEVMP